MLLSASANAQLSAPVDVTIDDDDGIAPQATAVRVEEAPVLDGEVLNDPVWQQAPTIEKFWQTTPVEGEPATEKTVVRIVFTEAALHLSVVCYTEDASKIIVSDALRDGNLTGIDSFQFILDTYRDTQSGFVFGTSPAGIEYDAQVTNEGAGVFGFAGQTSGSGGGLNVNWDGAWDVATQMGDFGWSAEFSIPFRTLRFPNRSVQSWGVNFQRNIRYNNEVVYWAKLPRQFNLYKVSMAGTLEGLEVPNPRNLKIMPYLLGQSSVDETGLTDGGQTGDVGVDVKYSLTPSMALDLTYNTDFAQVEVDEEQINLDRFNLFFPEKRPFFLENAGLFSVKSDGSVQTGSDVEMFFSRRIGIGPSGETVPIIGGARVSGNVGNNTSIGLLNMQTESLEGIAESSNYSVARVEQQLKNRSSIGAIFVNREGQSDLSVDVPYNRLLGIDGQLGIGKNSELNAYVATTFSPHLSGNQYAFDFSARRSTESFLLTFQYAEIADQFNPEIGFMARQSFRKLSTLVFNTIRPKDLIGLLEIRPHITYRSYWGYTDGFHETNYLHIDSHWEWHSGWEIHTGMNVRTEGVRDDFTLGGIEIPADSYNWVEAQAVLYSDPRKDLSFRNRSVVGGFFGGRRVTSSSSLNIRGGEKFTSQITWQRNNVFLTNGDFKSNLFRTRLSYSFTPRIFLQGLAQYNDQREIWSFNMRFGWLQTSNTGLFIVFNQANVLDLEDDGAVFYGLGDLQIRSVTLKYTYLFDVFK